MKLTFLGTGTSHGIPVIGCKCKVCKSSDPHNRRYRSSVYVETADQKYIQVDCGPEFRLQAIENNIKKIDAVLLTHSHADHIFGLDDLRIFSVALNHEPEDERGRRLLAAPPMPVYTNKKCIDDIKKRFDYIFTPARDGGGHAKLNLIEASSPFKIGATTVTPIPMTHGYLEATGWLFSEADINGGLKSIAYLTDCNKISDSSINLIRESAGSLKHLVIDGLRIKEHSTHFNFLQAMETAEKIGAEQIWFTHMTHNESHDEIVEYIKEHLKDFPGLAKAESVLPAYDKLVIQC